MALDAIHVHFEANDVLATSFAAMLVVESFPTEHALYARRGSAPNLNDSRPGGIIYIARAYAGQFCRRALAIYRATTP